MELLLMSKQKIAAREAPRTVLASKRLLLGMGPFMSLQMFQAGETSVASCTHMWPQFLCLRRSCLTGSLEYALPRLRLRAAYKSAVSS